MSLLAELHGLSNQHDDVVRTEAERRRAESQAALLSAIAADEAAHGTFFVQCADSAREAAKKGWKKSDLEWHWPGAFCQGTDIEPATGGPSVPETIWKPHLLEFGSAVVERLRQNGVTASHVVDYHWFSNQGPEPGNSGYAYLKILMSWS